MQKAPGSIPSEGREGGKVERKERENQGRKKGEREGRRKERKGGRKRGGTQLPARTKSEFHAYPILQFKFTPKG